MAKKVIEEVIEVKRELGEIDPRLKAMLSNLKGKSKIAIGGIPDESPRISTGSLSLDLKFGGGIASDRIVEYYGPSGSCKSSMGLILIANYVKKFGYGRPPLIIDLERTLTNSFIKGYGIDSEQCIYLRPDTAEETMDVLSTLIRSGTIGVAMLDSVDALESKEDVAKSYTEASMMKIAKLMSEAMRDLSKATVDYNTLLICINQCRVGSNGHQMVETVSGGGALKYYASQRCRFKTNGPSKDYKQALTIEAVPKKNKLSPGLIAADTSFEFIPGVGVLKMADYLDAATQFGVIRQGGPMYYLTAPDSHPAEEVSRTEDGIKIIGKFKGKAEFNSWLENPMNTDMFTEIVTTAFGIVKDDMKSQNDESDAD